MPNWCFNRVTIAGDVESIKKFKDKHLTTKFFDSVIPMPDSIRNTEKIFGESSSTDNWYDWSISNWGTKWDVDVSGQGNDEDQYIYLEFDTAWCPPEGVYLRLRELYPDLSISWFYDEPGMSIAGYLENQG